jgi:hypothetical protein
MKPNAVRKPVLTAALKQPRMLAGKQVLKSACNLTQSQAQVQVRTLVQDQNQVLIRLPSSSLVKKPDKLARMSLS